MCKSVYIEVSVGRNELFWHAWLVQVFSQNKGTNQVYQNNFFHHDTNLL